MMCLFYLFKKTKKASLSKSAEKFLTKRATPLEHNSHDAVTIFVTFSFTFRGIPAGRKLFRPTFEELFCLETKFSFNYSSLFHLNADFLIHF